ncbi:MAG: DUF3078 domain-containing protein [Prevotella sp.]|nr:DUF3078 domain-containing protein [Prevotella sp.]
MIYMIAVCVATHFQARAQTDSALYVHQNAANTVYEPRGINELLFSLSHIKADSLNIPLSKMPLMAQPYSVPKNVNFIPTLLAYSQYVRGETGLKEYRFTPSRADATAREIMEQYLITHPEKVRYLSWKLPEPPRLLPTEDRTDDFLVEDIPIEEPMPYVPDMIENVKRTNWLHKTDASLQFSQAYLSPNWYQGGNNSLSLLLGLLWDVKLNEVYHPSLMFESTLSYKLGLNSTPQDSVHNYSVSEDLLQYNMKFGVRARNKWFYSFTTQFKTQILNVYGENSRVRKAAFLSPGELNLGLGMTYSTTGLKKRLKLNVSLAPISYNLKICVDKAVDPTQFGIKAGRNTQSQVGSSAEVTLNWDLIANVSWRSRLFLFTNYDDFQGDWENTFNFAVNKFLSTQIYVHLRYDTSSDAVSNRWRHWMLKEILSFGFRYAFSTK